MGTTEMRIIAKLIDRVLRSEDEALWAQVKREVEEMARAFPLYGEVMATAARA